jgi:hypothetical protein
MLLLIKNNKKLAMEEVIKPTKRTTTDVLSGIGNGILEDLEMSIHQTRANNEENTD